MTMWEPFKLLLPAYSAFWLFSALLSAGFWYGWTKLNTKMAYNWKAPILFATFFSFVFCAYNFMTIYNGNTLYMAANPGGGQQNAQQQPVDPALKMKADFLSQVEKYIQNPSEVKTAKAKLFKEYAKLFPNAEAKKQYFKAISDVYSCQKIFWEDALAAFKTKQFVKSDSRKDCEKISGEFFNREKMIPEQTSKANDKLMEEIAKNQRVPASDGKTVDINEKMVRDAMEAQSQGLAVIKQIFE